MDDSSQSSYSYSCCQTKERVLEVHRAIRYYLLRHGETDFSKEGRYSGWDDAQLTEKGLWQHQQQVATLADTPLSAIYTSDLHRCMQLATDLAKSHDVPLDICRGLRELDFGLLGGKTYAEALREHPEALTRWVEHPAENAPPSGETLQTFGDRLLEAMQEIELQVREAPSDESTPISVAIVTHGGPIRILLCHWLGIPVERQWQFRIDPGSLTIVEQYAEGAICCRVNYQPDPIYIQRPH